MLKYSVITSIYKNIKTKDLILSLNSLNNQYLRPNEVIVIIDGYCNPRNLFIIKNFLKKNFKNKFKLSFNLKNKGIPFSYNKAISLTSYNFIGISDADDVSDKYRFYKQIKYLVNNPKIAILGSFVKEVGEKKTFIKKVPLENSKIYFTSFFKNPINHPTVVFNKKLFKKLKYEDCNRMEDYFLWLRAMSAGLKFSNLPETFVKSRVTNDFLKRRSGIQLVFSEFKIQKYILKKNYFLFILVIPLFVLKSFYHLIFSKFKNQIRRLINNII